MTKSHHPRGPGKLKGFGHPVCRTPTTPEHCKTPKLLIAPGTEKFGVRVVPKEHDAPIISIKTPRKSRIASIAMPERLLTMPQSAMTAHESSLTP